jgi:hypothetical protein
MAIICSIVFYSNFNNKKAKTSNDDLPYYNSQLANADKTESYVLKPKFYGVNKDNNPYSINASEGVQLKENTFALKNVYGDFTNYQDYISMIGKKAKITTDNHMIYLEGDINISYDDQYILSSDFAKIDYKNNAASGHGKVSLESNIGNINADKFEVMDNYTEIKFYGDRVKTILNMATSSTNE